MFSDSLSPSSKNRLGALIQILVGGLIIASLALAFSYVVSAKKSLYEAHLARQITVTGQGKATISPDVALFTVSFVTQASKLGNAKDENTNHSNAVLAFLKEKGVEEKDIKTVQYTISPQYVYTPVLPCYEGGCPSTRPPKISGYEVRHTLQVKVRDLGKVDDLLDGVVNNGANEVGQVQFTIDDEEAVKREARNKAIEDARKKAETMTRAVGVHLGKVITFSENGLYPISYAAESVAKVSDMRGAEAPAHIAPGEQEVEQTMSVTYEIW